MFVSGLSGPGVFSSVLMALAGSPNNQVVPDSQLLSFKTQPQRVDETVSTIARVDSDGGVTRMVAELEKVNTVGALRGAAVTAVSTLNSSIKRVHQGQ